MFVKGGTLKPGFEPCLFHRGSTRIPIHAPWFRAGALQFHLQNPQLVQRFQAIHHRRSVKFKISAADGSRLFRGRQCPGVNPIKALALQTPQATPKPLGAVTASVSATNRLSVQLNGWPPATTAEELEILRMPSKPDSCFGKRCWPSVSLQEEAFPPFLLQLAAGAGWGCRNTAVTCWCRSSQNPSSACPGQITRANGEGHGCSRSKFKCSPGRTPGQQSSPGCCCFPTAASLLFPLPGLCPPGAVAFVWSFRG